MHWLGKYEDHDIKFLRPSGKVWLWYIFSVKHADESMRG